MAVRLVSFCVVRCLTTDESSDRGISPRVVAVRVVVRRHERQTLRVAIDESTHVTQFRDRPAAPHGVGGRSKQFTR